MRWLVTKCSRIPIAILGPIAIAMALITLVTGRTFLFGPMAILGSLYAVAEDRIWIGWAYLGTLVGIFGELLLWNQYFWRW